MRLGVNPVWNSYTQPNIVWLNLLRGPASDWTGRKATTPFTFDWGPTNGGPDLDIDTDGNVLSLAADQQVQCALLSQANGRKDFSVAGRRLVLYYRGTGAWTVTGGSVTYALISNDTGSNPKRAVLSVNAPSSSAEIYFRLTSVDAGDPIKLYDANADDLGLIEEEYEDRWLSGQRFHPEYLAMNDFCRDIRFLNPGNVNDSTQTAWADRRPQAYRSQRSAGGWTNSDAFAPTAQTSYEEMIALCNATGKRPWFCIPHLATDDYVTQLGTLVRDTLNPSLKVRFEWSNEVWNNIFDQYDHAADEGLLLWPALAATPWIAAQRYYGLRTSQVMDLLSAVFTGAHAPRLIRMACWHAVNPGNCETMLDFTDAVTLTPLKDHIDRVGTAPYIGGDMGNNPQATVTTAPYDKAVQDMTAAEVMGWLRSGGSADIASRMVFLSQYRDLCDERGLGLDLYECGQHLANGTGLSGNATLTAVLNGANVHADMEACYYEYLRAIHPYLNDPDAVACLLSDTYPPGATGDWGWRRTQNTTPRPPKERGIRKYAASLVQRRVPRLVAAGALR